jgi:hypothetical protein
MLQTNTRAFHHGKKLVMGRRQGTDASCSLFAAQGVIPRVRMCGNVALSSTGRDPWGPRGRFDHLICISHPALASPNRVYPGARLMICRLLYLDSPGCHLGHHHYGLTLGIRPPYWVYYPSEPLWPTFPLLHRPPPRGRSTVGLAGISGCFLEGRGPVETETLTTMEHTIHAATQ